MYYIGIDIAKKAHEVCFLDQNGQVLDGNSFKIPNTLSGVDKLQKMLDKYGLTSKNAQVGMEATGHYWLALYSSLFEKGFDIKVINPIVTDALRNMRVRKVKNDRIDAEIVAKAIMFGEYQETAIADGDTLALRQLCRFRLWQVHSESDLKRKIIALLDQVFPEYTNLFSDIFGITSKELLLQYTTPEEMASLSARKLTLLLSKSSKGHFGQEKAMEIRAVAQSSMGIRIATDAFAFQIRQMVEQLEFIEEQTALLDQQIEAYMEKLDSPVTSIPGIDPVYGAVILSELGNIHRFPSAKQIVSFAGLDAQIKESGEFTGTQTHVHLIYDEQSGVRPSWHHGLILNSRTITSIYELEENLTGSQ